MSCSCHCGPCLVSCACRANYEHLDKIVNERLAATNARIDRLEERRNSANDALMLVRDAARNAYFNNGNVYKLYRAVIETIEANAS